MKGHLVRFLSQTLELVSIDIPRYSDVKKLVAMHHGINNSAIPYHKCWWIVNDKNSHKINYVTQAGLILEATTEDMSLAVRPMIVFKNRSYCIEEEWFDYEIGDEIQVKGLLFEIVGTINGNFAAICETDIGECPYNKKGYACPFVQSDLHAFMLEWVKGLHIITKDGTSKLKECNRIIKEKELEVSSPCFMPLDVETAEKVPWYNMPKETPFWLYGREDEFTGYCFEKGGNINATSLTTKANVVPCIRFSFAEDADNYCFFSLNGYLFRIITPEKAICYSSIGTSCFSTGIMNISDEVEEAQFYNDSEIGKIINNRANSFA